LLVLNKIDVNKDRSAVAVHRQDHIKPRLRSRAAGFRCQGTGQAELERAIVERLRGAGSLSADTLTDRSERFSRPNLCASSRCRLAQELPYATTVEIEEFREAEGRCEISAIIWVERDGQKAIVIGAGGAR
jgi:GTP-binding protein Era